MRRGVDSGKTDRTTGAGGGHAETQDGETAKAETAREETRAHRRKWREGARVRGVGETRVPRPPISRSAEWGAIAVQDRSSEMRVPANPSGFVPGDDGIADAPATLPRGAA